jgi:hypothetical protein
MARTAERLEITSGDSRTKAHMFYTRRGYSREGQRFSKWLSDPPHTGSERPDG